MKQLTYTGTRVRAFTVKCPSGKRYPVEPEVSRVIEVEEVDALHLLGTEPELWSPADVEAAALAEPAEKPKKAK